MHFSMTTLVAVVLGYSTYVHAHMIMAKPVPYGKSSLTNAPLLATGADYPCKQRTGVYDAEGANNEMALGSSQPLEFTGSAVHGGGSCQVSITYDQNPTADSTFKVIHSIIGGCPARNAAGNEGDNAGALDPDTYNFTIPTGLPTGSATLAWTWFNKIGNREMYMNCAPITLTGGSSKRDTIEERTAANSFYNGLPYMFRANSGNQCATLDSTDVIFPDPGDSVESDAASPTTKLPNPTNCGSGGPSGSSSNASGSAPSITSSPVAGASSAAASQPSNSGGVFASGASSATSAASMQSSAATATSTAQSGPASSAIASSVAAVPSGASPSSGGNSSSGSSTGSSSGTCSTSQDGQSICSGDGKQIGMCNAENSHTVASWKPITLQAPVLGSLVALSVLLITLLEILSKKSEKYGGILFAEDLNDLPKGQSFAYLYLPTVIAVFYSMIWTWIDLDVKRLEPYFQLSQPGGAPAMDSVLLHYPFDFVAFVPIRAARRRHWSVFCAGTAMVLIFWAITPLQSGIFSTATITASTSSPLVSRQSLLPVGIQSSTLDANFLNSAYSTLWLGQRLPPFTARDFAISPFVLDGLTANQAKNKTWSAGALMFTTELSCHAAIIGNTTLGYTFSNEKDCLTEPIQLPEFDLNRFSALYVGYYDDPNVDWSLQGLGCPPNASHNFLAVWSEGHGSFTSNITAMFCEPTYFVQDVNATITIPELVVASVTPQGPQRVLSDDLFNITDFEYIIGTGVIPNAQRRDIPGTAIVEQWPRLQNMSLAWPTTNMVGFAIGATRLESEEYMDPATLQAAFTDAHKILFSFAAHTLMASNTNTSAQEAGWISFRIDAVVVIRAFALIVEICIGLVAGLSCAIFWISMSRASKLPADPASMTNLAYLIPEDSGLLDEFNAIEDSTDLDRMLRNTRLELSIKGRDSKPDTSHRRSKPVRPFEMRLGIAAVFISVLIASIATIGGLQVWIKRHNADDVIGLPLPSSSPIVRQLLTNYLPTALSTFIEPFWVLLNRLLCILQPFEMLRQGKVNASKSLDLKYTSLPPQLVIWRALRARHFLLAMVCGVAFMANVLAVALSSLFQESRIMLRGTTIYDYGHQPRFNGTSLVYIGSNDGPPITYADHFYVAHTNISNGTALPPWITPEYYFLPFSPTPQDSVEQVDQHTAITKGFGVDLDCIQLNVTGNNSGVVFDMSANGKELNFSTPLTGSDGQEVQCIYYDGSGITIDLGGLPNGTVALEIMQQMNSENNIGLSPVLCEEFLMAGWLHASFGSAPADHSESSDTVSSLDSMLMACRPSFKTASFEVVADAAGEILASVQLGDFEKDLDKYFANSSTQSLLLAEMNSLMSASGNTHYWHNDSIANDWMNYLVKATSNISALIDPHASIPDFESTAAALEETYERLAAILLGLNPHVFTPSSGNDVVRGFVQWLSPRYFMSTPMFYIAIVILSINVVVAILYYVCRPKRFLPRMPTTIASMMAYFAASHAITELSARDRRLYTDSAWEDERFAYGKFIGTDGKTHVGIERHPFVIPLASTPAPLVETSLDGSGQRHRKHGQKSGSEGSEMTPFPAWI
ncbi:MAG: hypothetical protein M1819_005864 [Sarea resinae]|nr:MAG: hypothetical protein M1819_005864 [Sarea resinae]